MKKLKTALISVFYKDGLDVLIKKLDEFGIEIYSTGGTYDFILKQGFKAKTIESLTTYPSILGGRVKRCTRKFLVEFWRDSIWNQTENIWKNTIFLLLI